MDRNPVQKNFSHIDDNDDKGDRKKSANEDNKDNIDKDDNVNVNEKQKDINGWMDGWAERERNVDNKRNQFTVQSINQ